MNKHNVARTYTFKGWKLVVDPSEVCPDDPGEGTPAMVYTPEGDSATYFCAMDTGEVEYTDMPDAVYKWLESHDETVDAVVNARSP